MVSRPVICLLAVACSFPCLGAESSAASLTLANPASAAPTGEVRVAARPGANVELHPGRAWADLVIAAKATEEGDADLASAARDYATIVGIFEQLRTVAAEALRRQALVEKKLGHDNPSKLAWERLATWFPDMEDKAEEARRALGTAPGGGSSGVDPAVAAGGSGQPFGMSAELGRRYGLSGGEASAAASAADPFAGLSKPDEHVTERAILMQSRTELLAEAAKTSPELRRAQTELRRAKSAGVRRIPPTLVSDAQLRRLIETVSLPEAFAGNAQDLEKLQLERLNQAERYFEGVYLPRLELTIGLLSEELHRTRVELEKVDNELRKIFRKRLI
jgi:hypothetical protein